MSWLKLSLIGLTALALSACDTSTQTETTSQTETEPTSTDETVEPMDALEETAAPSEPASTGSPFAAAADIEPPVAEKRPVEIVQHGETRIDNYGWMRDDNWQQVLRDPSVLRQDIRDYLEAENAYYEAVMADAKPVEDKIFEEIRGRIKEDTSSVPMPDGPYAYYTRFREGGDYPIFARRPRDAEDETQEEILFDGDAESQGSEFFSIGGVDHSPNHELIAYGTDRVGSEYYTLKIRTIATGEEFPDAIENTDGDVVWANDSQTFFYIERDENQRPRRVKRHVLGTDPAEDAIVYEEADTGFFLGVGKSQSNQYIFISSGNSESSETRFLSADDPMGEPTLIHGREDDLLYSVNHHGDHFYIQTNADGAVDFKIVRAPITDPGRANWEDWLPHEPGRLVLGVTTFEDYIVRLERADAKPRIVVSDYDGNAHDIAFDEPAFATGFSSGYEFDTATLRMSYESPSTPEQTIDYDMATRERTVLKTQEVPSGHNPDLYTVERIDAPATDGAMVPVTILRLKSTPVDGSAPLFLYGYGSYGSTIPASFSVSRLSLVDRGAVYAIAHVRGSQARGRQWYLDGKYEKKVNTFTDFIAAAETLIERGYADPERVVIEGGSAGGLLVGAVVNMRPDLFAGVIAAVPFVDVVNTISDASLPLTPPEWQEWGDPINDPEAYATIKSYSPYDNVTAQEYPPMFLTAGLTDYRVTYWEPAKWAAKLREFTTSGEPILLRTNMGAGHAGSAARFESIREAAREYAFALKAFGLMDAEPVSHATE